MKKLLKIRFVKFEKTLVAQQLGTAKGFRLTGDDTSHIFVCLYSFSLCKNSVYIATEECDEIREVISLITFDSNAARDEYLEKVIKWISEELFATKGKLEIGKECEASDDGKDWFVRFFAGKSAKQLGEPRYLAFGDNNLGYLIRYKYVRPLGSFVRPKIDGDVYTWEMEVAE